MAFLASILAATLVTGVGPAVAQDAPTCDGLPATIVGTEGDDDIDGTAGDDVIAGLAGDDKIDGKGGNDTVCGGAGDDEIKTEGEITVPARKLLDICRALPADAKISFKLN